MSDFARIALKHVTKRIVNEKSRDERVAENKLKTYVVAVKRQNNTALKEVAEDLIK